MMIHRQNNKRNIYRIVVSIAVVVFIGVGYMGLRFINAVSSSADNIDDGHLRVASSVGINNETLNVNAVASVAHHAVWLQDTASQENQLISLGQDVIIRAGDFAYRNGIFQVHLSVQNQGQFDISDFYVKFALYVNDHAKPIVTAVLPANLPHALLKDMDTTVTWVIQGEQWQTAMVKEAHSRKLVAQVVSVTDNSSHIDYPQSSGGMLMQQIADDWSVKASSAVEINQLVETSDESIK